MLYLQLADHYVAAAWAAGDKALQAGRWWHIKLMLDGYELEHPGLMAEVMARLARLRLESKGGTHE